MQDFDDLHLSADDWDELHDPRPEECDFDRVMAAALSRRGFLSGLVAVGSGAAAMGRGAVLPGAAEAAERFGNSPDGMAFDSTGHLWIQTDGSDSNEGDFAGMGNNQMLVGGPARDVRRHPASRRAVSGWRGAAAALVHRGRDPQGRRSGGVRHAGPGTVVRLPPCGSGWVGRKRPFASWRRVRWPCVRALTAFYTATATGCCQRVDPLRWTQNCES